MQACKGLIVFNHRPRKCCLVAQAANLHGPRLVTELRSEREKNSLLATELRSERDRTSQLEVRLQKLVSHLLVISCWPYVVQRNITSSFLCPPTLSGISTLDHGRKVFLLCQDDYSSLCTGLVTCK